MTILSLKLSRALARGRAEAPPPDSRASLLASLLRKRATRTMSAPGELEALLRDQILWALADRARAVSHDTRVSAE